MNFFQISIVDFKIRISITSELILLGQGYADDRRQYPETLNICVHLDDTYIDNRCSDH